MSREGQMRASPVLIERASLLQVFERLFKISQMRQRSAEHRMSFDLERRVVAGFGQLDDLFGELARFAYLFAHHVEEPQTGKNRKKLGVITQLLAKIVSARVVLFDFGHSI